MRGRTLIILQPFRCNVRVSSFLFQSNVCSSDSFFILPTVAFLFLNHQYHACPHLGNGQLLPWMKVRKSRNGCVPRIPVISILLWGKVVINVRKKKGIKVESQ